MDLFNGANWGILSDQPLMSDLGPWRALYSLFFLAFKSQLMTCTDPCESDKKLHSFMWSHEFTHFFFLLCVKSVKVFRTIACKSATFHPGEWCSVSIQECKQLNLCLGVTYLCWDASHISMHNKLPQRGIQLASCHAVCDTYTDFPFQDGTHGDPVQELPRFSPQPATFTNSSPSYLPSPPFYHPVMPSHMAYPSVVVGKLENWKRRKVITLSMFRRGRAWDHIVEIGVLWWHSESCTCIQAIRSTLWIKSWWAHRDFD